MAAAYRYSLVIWLLALTAIAAPTQRFNGITASNLYSTVLLSDVSAGATAISVIGIPSNLKPDMGYLVIEPYSTNCEIREVASISGATVNIIGAAAYPLNYAHSAGTTAWWVDGINGVPWTWFGCKPNSTVAADVAANTVGFNRLGTNLYKLTVRGPAAIAMPAGRIRVNGELRPERDITLYGAGQLITIVEPSDDFPFDTTGEVNIFHPVRDGLPVVYATPGASLRLAFRDFMIDGRDVANARGILHSPQQPDYIRNVRFDRLTNALSIVDCQDYEMHNLEFIANGVAIRFLSASFVEAYGLNIEQSVVADFIAETQGGGGTACDNNKFIGIHVEQIPVALKSFDIQSGDNWSFDTVWITNPDTNGTLFYFNNAAGLSGKPIFRLENVRANAASSQYKMVDDVQRGRAITSETTKRVIQSLDSGIDGTNWAVLNTGLNIAHSGGADTPMVFGSGVRLGWTNGPVVVHGYGTFEGAYTAPIGSLGLRADGSTFTSLYFKESGAGNSGWVTRDSGLPVLLPATGTRNVISNTTDNVGFTVDGFAAGAAQIFQVRKSDGTVALTVGPGGSGRVGMGGITAPGYPAQVNGTIEADGFALADQAVLASSSGWLNLASGFTTVGSVTGQRLYISRTINLAPANLASILQVNEINTTTHIGFQIRGVASQSANMMELLASDNSVRAAFGANGGLKLGLNGTEITNVLTGSASLDFPDTAAQTHSDLPITVTGTTTNDVPDIAVPWQMQMDGSSYSKFPSNDTVWVRFVNASATAKNPAVGTVRAKVTKW